MRSFTILLVALVVAFAGPSACTDPTATEQFAHFPLRALHEPLTCADCHADDLRAAVPSDCRGCHEDARPAEHYDGDCAACHSEAGWEYGIADFEHDDFFPTPHRGVSACDSCHLQAPTYTTFSCIDCHEHRQSRMDSEHRGETNNYRWESNACLDCHPQGRE